MSPKTHTHCRQCGFPIVPGCFHAQDREAQKKGFCCYGCQAVNEKIIEDLKRQAGADL